MIAELNRIYHKKAFRAVCVAGLGALALPLAMSEHFQGPYTAIVNFLPSPAYAGVLSALGGVAMAWGFWTANRNMAKVIKFDVA